MGHERIGFLPKRQSWNNIVSQLGQFNNNQELVSKIAFNTLENIRERYLKMPYDESINKAIKFLSILTLSAKKNNQLGFLADSGIPITSLSLFALARAAKEYIQIKQGSLETNKIACDAILEAIAKYEHTHKIQQNNLFDEKPDNIWTKIGNGATFCELARGFFASFTDRYLRYFIEREAAHNINSIEKQNFFNKELSEQISNHSHETSKIMQSFAAGWFNKYSLDGIPNNDEIKGFLKLSFEKMREEFRREAEKNE
jgi:hypothetical protein